VGPRIGADFAVAELTPLEVLLEDDDDELADDGKGKV
jgi:hypothetical protein